MSYRAEFNFGHAKRGVDLAIRWSNFLMSIGAPIPNWSAAASLESDIESYVAESAEQRGVSLWRVAVAWLRVIVADKQVRQAARNHSGPLTNLRECLAVLLQDADELVSNLDLSELRIQFGQSYDLGNVKVRQDAVLAALRRLPLPTLYLKTPEDRWRGRRPEKSSADNAIVEPPLLKVICFLDECPLVTPQLLRPGLLYSLKFRVRGLSWPVGATSLRLDLLSTVPADVYSVSEFVIAKPSDDGTFEAESAGFIRFSVPQSRLSGDMVFSVQGGFLFPDKGLTETPVVGHHEIRFQVSDTNRIGLESVNRQLDLHVTGLLEKLLKQAPTVTAELPTLQPVLETLVGILAVFAQEGMYKGQVNVDEKQFQREVMRLMRLKLGSEVQEHGQQAGGITDVRYQGVIVELKVEKNTASRAKIAAKYTAQPTQYAGSEARQVAVTLVLDLTEKDRPPGDIRNDILLVDVPTHGNSDPETLYPSKAFVFVVNGNIRNPSSYS